MSRFLVSRASLPPTDEVGLSSENLYTGVNEFREYFGEIDPLEEDLLLVAAGLFAADRATVRGEREAFHRELEVTFALAHPERFERAKQRLESVLFLLTHDSWRLKFEADSLASRSPIAKWPEPGAGTTLLFSGGIDSLAAAIEQLDRPPLQLVSHHTRNSRTRAAQTSLAEGLRKLGFDGQHRSFFVSSRDRGGLLRHACQATPTLTS